MFANSAEAGKKWCPMALTALGSGVSVNREHDGSFFFECRCIADRCMVWRWKDSGKNEEGFCGLAGDPGNR